MKKANEPYSSNLDYKLGKPDFLGIVAACGLLALIGCKHYHVIKDIVKAEYRIVNPQQTNYTRIK